MSKSWFKISNAAADEAEISIYDVIGGWGLNARSFIQQLKAITAKKINLRIHSPGGDVFEGHAIFNALQRHPATITTHIDGIAASMASVIALAGKTVNIAQNGMIMIHNPSACGGGTADELRKRAGLLDKIKEALINAYETKTGLTRDEIGKMMDEETWLSAEEAVAMGFADCVTGEVKATASLAAGFDFSAFAKTPAALLVDTPASDDMKFLTASLAAALCSLSGVTLTEASTEAEIKAAFDALDGKVKALDKDKSDLTARATAAEGQVTALQGEKTELTNKLQAAQGEVTKLTNASKTTDQKAQELAAAHGSTGAKKDAGEVTAATKDLKSIFAKYQALTGRAQALFFKEHEKDLDAYAAAEDARIRRERQED